MSSDPNKPDFVSLWFEPPSAANTAYPPQYPYNHVTQTDGGHMIELDDTLGRKRIRIQHGGPDEITAGVPAFSGGQSASSNGTTLNSATPIGSFVEWHPNGDTVYKVVGDGYEIILQDKNMIVNGKLNMTVVGDARIWHQGNRIEQVDGDYELSVGGNYSVIAHQNAEITSLGNMNINAGGPINGSIVLNTQHVKVTGDLNAATAVTSDIIQGNRVNALMGMRSGIWGFVTLEGGFAAGIPIATPLTMTAAGPVSSLTQVNSPVAVHGLASSIFHFDIINNLLHNIHTHLSAAGQTTPPVPPMKAGT